MSTTLTTTASAQASSSILLPPSMLPSPAEGFKLGEGDLKALTEPPKFNSVEEERQYLKRTLVGALRIFAREGLDLGVAGHITVRDPENPQNFWVNPFGLSMRCVCIADLILVNEEGEVIGGGRPGRRIVNLAGFKIHSAIHKARPEVNAVAHSHSTYGKAFSVFGRPIDITTQDACAFYEDHAVLTAFGGVVVTDDEGGNITRALGQNKAIILQNHGLLSVGGSLQSAVAWFILMEKCCQTQLLVDAASVRSAPVPIGDEEARFTRDEIATERGGYFLAQSYYQVIEKLEGHEFDD